MVEYAAMSLIQQIAAVIKGASRAKRTEDPVPRRRIDERRIVYPFASVREQALSDLRRIRVLARARPDERGRAARQVSADPIRETSLALIDAARQFGLFINRKDVPGTRYSIRTGESEVRLVQRDQVYYKIKDPFAKLHLKRHPPEYAIFEHLVHNILFPDCRLDLVGVSSEMDEVRLVLRQAAIRSDRRPDDRQIADDLACRGLRPEGRYAFANDFVSVTDVGQDGDNVLLDDEDRLRFIDPIIGFKKPLQELLLEADEESLADRLVRNLLPPPIPSSS